MRSAQWNITTTPIKIIDQVTSNTVFMLLNRSPDKLIYLQFGNMPGHTLDAWPVRANEVFVLDPRVARETMDAIWIWGEVENINNVVLIG